MKRFRTAAIALVLGLAVATPADAFFFRKHKAVAAETAKHLICAFFCAILHCKK